MRARGVWLSQKALGPEWSPLAGWLTQPTRPNGVGVVILPPIGYAHSSSHRFLRRVAESLGAHDVTVLRVDYPGTGDSAGHVADVIELDVWRSTLPVAAAFLRDLGVTTLVLIGCQLGATFAMLDGPDENPAGIVTIAPVLSGRRFVRSLRMIGIPSPAEIDGIALGGHYFSGDVLSEIGALSVSEPSGIPLLAIPDQASVDGFLERPAEEAVADPLLVAEISDWVRAVAATEAHPRPPQPQDAVEAIPASTRILTHGGLVVREEFVTVEPDGLAGVLTTAIDSSPSDDLFVLVNSGSDPHTGPGRAWVELARDLATRGHSTLRMDLRGWGESPDGPSVPGRPYDAHGVQDIVRAAQALRHQGTRRIVLGGLCAGAWIALQAAREVDVDVAGVVALNPQLYWQPGDPVEALMSTTRRRRLEEIADIKRNAATGRWDDEDAQGSRPPAAECLDDLVRLGRPASLIFAEADDGLEYLQDRLGRRLRESTESSVIDVVELIGVDHGMHRTWLRQTVFDAVATQIDRILAMSSSFDPVSPRALSREAHLEAGGA